MGIEEEKQKMLKWLKGCNVPVILNVAIMVVSDYVKPRILVKVIL